MVSINEKIILVTGASRGFGYQVSKLLAREGAHVLALGRTVGGLENLFDEISKTNGSSTMIPLDLTNDSALDALAKDILNKWAKVDVLIHAAGIAPPMSPINSISLKDFEKSFATNTRALIKLIQVMDPLLKLSNCGKAIFIDDLNNGKFLAAYSASKAAAREIVSSYKEESKRLGVSVETFIPNPMPTAIRSRFYPGESKENLSDIISESSRLVSGLKS